jgi:hypothetical protein
MRVSLRARCDETVTGRDDQGLKTSKGRRMPGLTAPRHILKARMAVKKIGSGKSWRMQVRAAEALAVHSWTPNFDADLSLDLKGIAVKRMIVYRVFRRRTVDRSRS